jgi:hypothetical protein
MAGPLVWLECQGCGAKLARARLESAEDVVEIKCHRSGCHTVSSFTAQPVDARLIPDGRGGFYTVPVSGILN